MTLPELKAWLEGFIEAVDGAPTTEQWERLKDRIKNVGVPHIAVGMTAGGLQYASGLCTNQNQLYQGIAGRNANT